MDRSRPHSRYMPISALITVLKPTRTPSQFMPYVEAQCQSNETQLVTTDNDRVALQSPLSAHPPPWLSTAVPRPCAHTSMLLVGTWHSAAPSDEGQGMVSQQMQALYHAAPLQVRPHLQEVADNGKVTPDYCQIQRGAGL